MPSRYSILKGDELWEKVSNTLGETLGRELGVSASDFGQGSSRPVIRGLAGPRVRVLQNGLGSMDVSTISVDHAVTLEPMNAQQIEVLRGPSTLLFGSGASGGLVNISNNRIHEEIPEPFAATLNAGYNSVANAKILGFNSDVALKNVGFHFDILTRRSDNYNAGVGEILNSSVETDDINAGVSLFEGPGESGTVFKNDEWEGRLELQHQPIKQWDGTMGVQYRNRSFSAIGDEAFVPGTKLRAVGFFLLEDRDWKDWHFEFGARLPGRAFTANIRYIF